MPLNFKRREDTITKTMLKPQTVYVLTVIQNTIYGAAVASVLAGMAIFFLFVVKTVIWGFPSEESIWCNEYHPTLTFEECAKEAGW